MKLVIGTHNQGKLREYQRLLDGVPFEIVGLHELGMGKMDVDETGDTFLANAALKATTYARATGQIALADDSGLVVDALDGAPGVYCARFGGEGLDDAGRRAYLLEQLKDVPEAERTARFMCVITVYDIRTGKTIAVEGTCEGRILTEERDGGHGFGYDALFVPDGYSETFAELAPEVKNSISHRGNAAAKMLPLLADL
jgi:non-canonical purine NTP pyrophosphatase (RdgB/HAM1 family)